MFILNTYTNIKYITIQPSLLLFPFANFSFLLNIEEEYDAGRSVPPIFSPYIRIYRKSEKSNVYVEIFRQVHYISLLIETGASNISSFVEIEQIAF